MDKEYETKVLNIKTSTLVAQLRKLGATETPEFLLRRYVFDIESSDVEWIRLREGNGKTTMTYKHKVIGNTEIGKTIEIEVVVSDFDKTAEILSKLSFKHIYYQENKSWIFRINEIEFSIDTWPMLQPYLEVEAKSKEQVEKGLELLGLTGKDVGDKDIKEIYQEKGIDLHAHDRLQFS